MSTKDSVSCGCKGPLIGRRTVVLGAAGVAVGLSVGGALADEATMQGPQIGDLLVRATGKDKVTPIKVANVEVGAQYPMQAWPADPTTGVARDGVFYNVMLLTAYAPADLNEAVRATSADGVLANTIICPHAACEVTDFDPATAVAECPCHFSKFNLKEGGALVNGPATRKLPSISLASDAEGRLIIASAFDSRVGGDAE